MGPQMLKSLFGTVSKVLLVLLAIPLAISIFPIYAVYSFFSKGKQIKHNSPFIMNKKASCRKPSKKGDSRDWIDRLEEYDALLHD